jgi:hypothetical protein
MSLSQKRLQRQIAANTELLRRWRSGTWFEVYGKLPDLPVEDNDPSLVKSALNQGPAAGATYSIKPAAQATAEEFGALIQLQQQRAAK